MARLRRAPSAQPAATAKSTRQALKDRTNTAPRKPFVYEDDGDAEPLVKDARPRRGRAKQLADDADQYVMAGGLGMREPDENAEPPMTTDELAKSDGSPRLSVKGAGSTQPAKTTTRSKAQSKTASGTKSRARQPVRKATASRKSKDLPDDQIVVSSSETVSAKSRNARNSNGSTRERSGLSLSPSPPPAERLNSLKRTSIVQPGSALRTSGTPAVESSILALKNFKRRPRQPSMLQMVQQRTASARPSMHNVSATAQAAEVAVESSDLEDEDDFAPEAEGTPVLKKAKAPAHAAQKTVQKQHDLSIAPGNSTAQSKKRKSYENERSSSALDALKSKRQRLSKPDEAPVTRAAQISPLRRSSSTIRRTPQPELTFDVQVVKSSSSTPLTDPPSPQSPGEPKDWDDIVPSTEKEDDYVVPHDPGDDFEDDEQEALPNDTMADPLSSPLQSSPPKGTQQTDIMADPLTQISPAKPKVPDKKTKKVRPMNTADLQALLPRRRKPLEPRHRKSEYDIDSESEEDDNPIDTSHLAVDEDELSSSVRRKTKSRTPAKSRKSTAVKSRKSKAVPPPRKSAAPPRKSKSSKGPSKTYGRANASDKENEEFVDDENDHSHLPDTSISGIEAAKSTELEAMAAKFAELDEWDMEFESVEVEEGRSSSQLWR